MADCSKTVVFLEEHDRMCKMYACSEACPFTKRMERCFRLMHKEPETVVEVVQRWSDAHPKKDGETNG